MTFQGKKAIEWIDRTFENAGRLGVWRRADNVTLFDDFTLKRLASVEDAQRVSFGTQGILRLAPYSLTKVCHTTPCLRLMKKLALFVLLAAAESILAQTATLRGVVADESGAIIPKANVVINGPGGLTNTVLAGDDGSYTFTGLTPGNYTVEAAAPELTLPEPQKISLGAGVQTLNLRLRVASTAQQVTVQENAGPAVSTDPTNNAGALTLRGDDLQALSDDLDDLAADLQALAGPSAGPNGGQLFVDGFTGGQLPPKESIREIRVNSNPFSPEYDTLGYSRIEIFTKPGTDKFRGTGFYNFGDSFWNSRNPYAAEKAPFLLKEYGDNLSGPLSKRASFTFDIQRHAIDNGAIINGSIVDPQNLAIVDPYTQVFRIPQRRVIITPRID